MRKRTIRYTSSLDALIAAARRSSIHESRQKMDSEEFFDRYSRGRLSDDAMFVEWANDYRHHGAPSPQGAMGDVSMIRRAARPAPCRTPTADLGRCRPGSLDDVAEALAAAEGERFR